MVEMKALLKTQTRTVVVVVVGWFSCSNGKRSITNGIHLSQKLSFSRLVPGHKSASFRSVWIQLALEKTWENNLTLVPFLCIKLHHHPYSGILAAKQVALMPNS